MDQGKVTNIWERDKASHVLSYYHPHRHPWSIHLFQWKVYNREVSQHIISYGCVPIKTLTLIFIFPLCKKPTPIFPRTKTTSLLFSIFFFEKGSWFVHNLKFFSLGIACIIRILAMLSWRKSKKAIFSQLQFSKGTRYICIIQRTIVPSKKIILPSQRS